MDGRVALVIGGGGGAIGTSIVRALAASGCAAIGIVDLDLARAESAAREIDDSFAGRVVPLEADVRDSGEVDDLVARAFAELGRIDALITVVGGMGSMFPWTPLDQISDDMWDRLHDINLRYVFRVLRAALPRMVEHGGGTVVSLGSLAGVTGVPMGAGYGAAKAGVISLARTVAAEYGGRGIRMNVVNCGLIATPGASSTMAAGITEPIPAGRVGEPDEIAEAVLFFASDASRYVSGQYLNIDGGVTARFPLMLPGTDRSMAG